MWVWILISFFIGGFIGMIMAAVIMASRDVHDNSVGNIWENPHDTDLIRRESAKLAYCRNFCHPGAMCPDCFCIEVNKAFDIIPSVNVKEEGNA